MDKQGRYETQYRGREYRTNIKGQGLWKWDELQKNWRQIIGTCDFDVNSDKSMYRKVRRIYR